MFKCKDCECNKDVIEKLEEHSKQHKYEHYLVLAILGIILALEIYPYVI